jgi:hypothetical protein
MKAGRKEIVNVMLTNNSGCIFCLPSFYNRDKRFCPHMSRFKIDEPAEVGDFLPDLFFHQESGREQSEDRLRGDGVNLPGQVDTIVTIQVVVGQEGVEGGAPVQLFFGDSEGSMVVAAQVDFQAVMKKDIFLSPGMFSCTNKENIYFV